MKSGAIDYLSKPFRDEDLLGAVKQAVVRASEQRVKSLQRKEVRARLATLTPREFDVLKLVIGGNGSDAITRQSKDRTLDGKVLPDIKEIKMKRVPLNNPDFRNLSTMLRKILSFTLVVYAAALFTSANALAWGCGSWNRSGSASYTGRYGNTYSRSYSSSGSFSGGGYHYGGYHYGGAYYGGGYHYATGGGYYGGGFRPGAFLTGYAAGVYSSQ
jgi:hypothetical protein